ncbi:MAG: PKD domain-containing protein [Ekhidna sp.]|nr:PKD domain-containing protein [Ekhidna sp.]
MSLYDGVVSVSVPLYEAQANNGATVPVSLQYNAGGIRVNEVSGVAGLGWQLIAGGAITRVMRGEPDEQARFTETLSYHKMSQLRENTKYYDFEKDLFYFSFPGGSGRFIFGSDYVTWSNQKYTDDPFYNQCMNRYRSDYNSCYYPCRYSERNSHETCHARCSSNNCQKRTNGQAGLSFDKFHALPSSDLKIEFVKNSDLNSHFIITDIYGNKYYFGQTYSSRETTTTNYKDNRDNTSYVRENERQFISTWHLDRIVYANQPESNGIDLRYIGRTLIEEERSYMAGLGDSYQSCLVSCSTDDNCNHCMRKRYDINYFKSTITAKYVSVIQFPKGKVEFKYNFSRFDLSDGVRLTSVQLKDHNNREVSTTNLNQSYFDARNSYYKGGKNTFAFGEKRYRLRLNSLVKDGLAVYKFGYINDNNELHVGGANKYELPPRGSYYTDHWGFYNGGPHQGSQSRLYVWNAEYRNRSSYITKGMNKSPNGYARANILTKVTFPTGGSQEFTYGSHANHGGVRIGAIRHFDKNRNLVSGTSYTYYDENQAPRTTTYVGYKFKYWRSGGVGVGKKQFALIQYPASNIWEVSGPSNGYGRVRETSILDRNYVDHYFKDLRDRPLVIEEKKHVIIDKINESIRFSDNDFVENNYPFSPASQSYYDRGIEWKTIIYDEGNKKVSETEYKYEHEKRPDYTVRNHTFHYFKYEEHENWLGRDKRIKFHYEVPTYSITTRNIYLDYSVTKSYDNDGVSLMTTTKTDYIYNHNHETLPVQVITMNSGGENHAVNQRIYYPFSSFIPEKRLLKSSVLSSMVGRHMIGVPIVTEYQVKLPSHSSYRTSSVSLNDYRIFSNKIQLYKRYSLSLSQPGRWNSSDLENISIMSYHTNGLVSSNLSSRDGITTNYIYDAQGYLLSETVDPGVESLKRTISYTYQPLVGVKTVTNPTGETITYEYDNRNRLHLIRDEDNNIIKRYRYNYGNERNTMSAAINVTAGTVYVGQRKSFSVSGLNHYGPAEYKWIVNDIEVANGRSMSYTFTTPGIKEVKFVVINAEDGVFETSRRIFVR